MKKDVLIFWVIIMPGILVFVIHAAPIFLSRFRRKKIEAGQPADGVK